MGSEIVQSYRLLYRLGLRAVQYSQPHRFVIRDRLRRAYRYSPASDFDPRRIRNTALFLEAAAKDRGYEHRLVKSLCSVWVVELHAYRAKPMRLRTLRYYAKKEAAMVVTQAYDQFYYTLRMLNETMGLCLR